MEEISLTRIAAACAEHAALVAALAIVLGLAGTVVVRLLPAAEQLWHAVSLALIIFVAVVRVPGLFRAILWHQGKAE
ncbi:MAG TPA: hypothetical protein VGE12_03805 [Noviherbaspirillum sp.]